MSHPRFVQIHWLASYNAALLNRDDAGFAKRMPFGGATRARISSQCLKRHWRTADDARALSRIGVPMGSRTKEIVERILMPDVAAGADPKVAKAVADELVTAIYGEKAKDSAKRQALFFGQPEIDYLKNKVAQMFAGDDPAAAAGAFKKDYKANLKAMREAAAHPGGLESALFGRMVTSDTAANMDAAIHVAHALSVHAIERELDFMSVVDDLKDRLSGDDAGAAGVFDMELTSALYYGYVVVDGPALIRNLAGESDVAGRVVENLIHLIAEVSPGAKKGSTAPYGRAEFVLVESGDRQPRSLANAFRSALPLRTNRLLENAVDALGAHLAKLDAAYATDEARRALNVSETAFAAPGGALADIAAWAGAEIRRVAV